MPARRSLPPTPEREALAVAALIAGTLLLAGCTGVEPSRGLPEPFARAQVFCYRTLAEVECFANPVPGEDGRLTGVAWSGPFRIPVVLVPSENDSS